MDVKTLCLGALTLGNASGYEIKKMFEEGPFAYFHQAGYGSIYPALGKLCEEGLVSMQEHEQDGRPDKKVYGLTAKGKTALEGKLTMQPAKDKVRSEALVMFFLAEHMDAEHLRKVFDGYLACYRNNLECVNSLDDKGVSPHRLFVRGFGKAFYQAAVSYMEENSHLLFAETDLRKTGASK